MPTPGERRALMFIAAVAALGVGARGWIELRGSGRPPAAGDRAALARQIESVDSAIAAGGVRRSWSGSPARSGSPTGSGSSARRASPAARGPSRTGEAPGAANDAGRRPRVVAPVPPSEPPFDPRALYRLRRQRADTAHAAPPRTLRSRGASAERRPAGRSATAPVDLDTAPQGEIELLPGIGPALAARIVGDRTMRGPFGSLQALERVPGVGAALARRLQSHVTFSLTPRLGGAVEAWPKARYQRPRVR